MVSFSGIRFWTSVNVPPTVKLDIRKHGGEIVKLERDADILLTDHEKSSLPDGAYSYLWVNRCIELNAQVENAPYLVATMRQSRGLPSSQPPSQPPSQPLTSRLGIPLSAQTGRRKHVRTPFTDEDDHILAEWMRQKMARTEYARNSVSGNVLYQDLANLYPHHTYHSWRDRWIKKLCFTVDLDAPHRSRPIVFPSPKPETPARSQPQPQPQQPPSQHPPSSQPLQIQQESSSQVVHPPVEDLTGVPLDNWRLNFLSSNDRLLFKELFSALARGESSATDSFFQRLNEQRPSVSVAKWKECFLQLQSWYSYIGRYRNKTLDQLLSGHDQEFGEAPAASQAQSETRRDNEKEDERGEEEEDGGDDDDLLQEIAAQSDDQKQFYARVDHFNSINRVYIPRSFVIDGRLVDTWALWSTVQTVSPDADQRDWARIAETFNFDQAAHPGVEEHLAAWYDYNLSEVEAAIKAFEEGRVAGSSGDEEEDESSTSRPPKRRRESAFSDDDDDDTPTQATAKRTRVLHAVAGVYSGDVEEGFEPPPQRTPSRTPRSRPPPRSSAVQVDVDEPETQDFAFQSERQASEVTPCQQLQSEELAIHAVPLSLPPRRTRPEAGSGSGSASAHRQSLPASFAGHKRTTG